MKPKSENKWLWPVLGLALLALFIGSIASDSLQFQHQKLVEANTVTSIAEIPVP